MIIFVYSCHKKLKETCKSKNKVMEMEQAQADEAQEETSEDEGVYGPVSSIPMH